MHGVYVDLTTPKKCTDTCHECGEAFKSRGKLSGIFIELYDDPFAIEPRIVKLHNRNDQGGGTCLDKLTDTGWADFRYFTCDCCGRLVARQCGYNGWRSYVKIVGDEERCIKCYQEDRLENGEPREAFDDGRIPGDFYSEADLEDHGWEPVGSLQNYYINSAERIAWFLSGVANSRREGRKVLVNYNSSMAYGDIEGYISLYSKEAV